MTQIKYGWVDSSGVRLRVAYAGDSRLPLLICLHGFPENHESWLPYLPALSEDHFVVAPDGRGFGESARPDGVAAYKIDCLMADVLAVARHFGAERFALAGHDWGGSVAWHLAMRHADVLARLAILNAPHPMLYQRLMQSSAAQREAAQYTRRLCAPDFESSIRASSIEAFWMRLFGDHYARGVISKEARAKHIAQWSQPGALTAMTNWYRASDLVVPAPNDPLIDSIVSMPLPIAVPTNVIWGIKDTLLLSPLVDDLAGYVSALHITRLDAGHGLLHEDRDGVAQALAYWLA